MHDGHLRILHCECIERSLFILRTSVGGTRSYKSSTAQQQQHHSQSGTKEKKKYDKKKSEASAATVKKSEKNKVDDAIQKKKNEHRTIGQVQAIRRSTTMRSTPLLQ